VVENALEDEGYTKVTTKDGTLPGVRTFAKGPKIGKTLYGTTWRPDYLCCTPVHSRLLIECKWQQSNGSVDEKYPYLVQNILLTKIPTIIVIDGGGMKEGAVDWLRSQIDDKILLGVYSMSEFQRMVNDEQIL